MPDIYDDLIDKGWTEVGISEALTKVGYSPEEVAPIADEFKRRRTSYSFVEDVKNVGRGIGGSLTALGALGAGIVTTGAKGVASAAEAMGAQDFASRVRQNAEDYRTEAESLTRGALKATEASPRGSIVGDVVGGLGRVAEYPLPVRSTFDLADKGVDVQSAGGRTLVGLRSFTGGAQAAMPLFRAGGALTRGATGAAYGASGTVLDNALLEGAAALDEENRAAYESQQASLKDIGVEAGVGAGLSVLLGRRPVIPTTSTVADQSIIDAASKLEAVPRRPLGDGGIAAKLDAANQVQQYTFKNPKLAERIAGMDPELALNLIRREEGVIGQDVINAELDPQRMAAVRAQDEARAAVERDAKAQAQLDAEAAAQRLRDEEAQRQLDAELRAAEDAAKANRIAAAEAATRSAELSNAPGDTIRPTTLEEVNDIAVRQSNAIRTVVTNRQLGPDIRDNLLNRVKTWRAESLQAIARGEPSLPVPKLDELGTPAERNLQAETASMQQRQAVESAATRPLREAAAESDANTMRAEIEALRAEVERLRSGVTQPAKVAEQQAIEADKALAAGEAAVAPDRRMIANADKAIRRAEYEMTGKTSRVPVAESAPAVTPVVESAPRVETPQVAETKTVPEGKAGAHTVYHGTSKAEFQNLDPYIGEYGLFGGGTYWTSDPNIAKEYTTKGKGKSPGIYESTIEVKNPLDMDKPADVAKWKSVLEGDDFVGQYVDLNGVTTNESVLRRIEDAMGERGDITRGDAQELVQDFIVKMGYDSITHVGGGRHASSKGTKHRVYITFDPEQVKTTRKLADTSTVVPEAPRAEVQPTPVATEPVSRPAPVEAPSKPVAQTPSETPAKRQFFADDTAAAGYREVTDRVDPKFYEGKQLVDLDWIRANDPKGAKRAERLEKQAKVQLGRNQSRTGGTSIPSMVADAIINTVKAAGPKLSATLKEIATNPVTRSVVDGLSWGKATLYAGTKSRLSEKSREVITRMEENYTARLRDHFQKINDAVAKVSLNSITDRAKINAYDAATAEPDSKSAAAVGNSYRAPLLDMLEGKTPVPTALKDMIEAVWETNRFTRKMAIDAGLDVGKGYVNGVGYNRRLTPEVFNALMYDQNPALKKALIEDLARRNGMSVESVQNHFATAEPKGDVSALVRFDAQEFSRKFKDMPSHVKVDGKWVPVLDLDLNNYVQSLPRSTAKRAAGSETLNNQTIGDYLKANKIEGQDAKFFADTVSNFYDISPTAKLDHAVLDGPIMRGLSAFAKANNQLLLSAAHVTNIGDVAMIAHVAPRQYWKYGAKFGTDVKAGEGGFNFENPVNTVDLRGRPEDLLAKLDMAMRATGVHRIPHQIAKQAYAVTHAYYKDNVGRDTPEFRMYLDHAGLSKELKDKLLEGKATERDIAVAAAQPVKFFFGRDLVGSQKAGMEQSRLLRFAGPLFRSYEQKTLRVAGRSFNTIGKIMSNKSVPLNDRVERSAGILAKLFVGQAANGAFYLVVRGAMVGALATVFDDAWDRAKHFNAENTAWLLSQFVLGGGILSRSLEGITSDNPKAMTPGEAFKTVASNASAPFAAVFGTIDAFNKNADALISRVPLASRSIQLAEGTGEAKAARSMFYRIRSEIDPYSGGKPEKNAVTDAVAEVVSAVESGKDARAALRAALQAAAAENPGASFNDLMRDVSRKIESKAYFTSYEERLKATALSERATAANKKKAADRLRVLRQRMGENADTLRKAEKPLMDLAKSLQPIELD